jgi:hypothetical protein
MTATNSTRTSAGSLARDWLGVARYYLGGRGGLLIVAATVVAGGLALNWSWLVAAGIAPLLIGVLPCVAMCALGLCMHKMGGQSCAADTTVREAAEPSPNEVRPSQSVQASTGQLELPWGGDEVEIGNTGDVSTALSERSKTDA